MIEKILAKIGLATFGAMSAFIDSRGGLVVSLAEQLKALEDLGGVWSFTFTVLDNGKAEVHLLRVGMAPPLHRKGWRKPPKGAPDVAGVDRKAVFVGPPENLSAWIANVRGEILAEQKAGRA